MTAKNKSDTEKKSRFPKTALTAHFSLRFSNQQIDSMVSWFFSLSLSGNLRFFPKMQERKKAIGKTLKIVVIIFFFLLNEMAIKANTRKNVSAKILIFFLEKKLSTKICHQNFFGLYKRHRRPEKS